MIKWALGFFAPAMLLTLVTHDAQAGSVTLPAIGVTVDLRGDWKAESTPTVDTIERTNPATPFIGIGFVLMKNDTECEKRLVRMAQQAGGDMQPRPNFVPSGYFNKIADVSIKYGEGSVRHEVIACGVTGSGALHASIQFDVPLSTEDFTMVRVALDRVAGAVDRLSGAPPSKGGSSDDDSSSEPSSSSKGPGHSGGPYELAGVMIKPADARQTTGYGGTFGMDLTEIIGSDAIGFAYNFSGFIGGESASRILYDAKFGLGLSLSLPHVQLIPLVSLGFDGGSGADPLPGNAGDDFNIKAAGYWDLGGRVRLRFSGQAFELGFDRLTRGSFFKGPDAPIGIEHRFLLKYMIAGSIRPWIGARYIDYQGMQTSAGVANSSAAGIALMFGFKI